MPRAENFVKLHNLFSKRTNVLARSFRNDFWVNKSHAMSTEIYCTFNTQKKERQMDLIEFRAKPNVLVIEFIEAYPL